MDPVTTSAPVLQALARELAESPRLRAFVDEPGRARVSEPLLAFFLAAVHLARPGPLVCLFPDDGDARDAAEAAGWFVGEDSIALLASRGVRWESGLQPPAHLVGERARALEVLAAGGLVCVSALGYAEGLPPADQRPETIRVRVGEEPGIEGLAEELALAGYERVERVEARGTFAVRGGIVDVFPSTGREPVRIELFGDEVESIRAFSAFTQRALRALEEAVVYPAAERRVDLVELELGDEEPPRAPDDLVASIPNPDLVWNPDGVREVWREELATELTLGNAAELDQLPSGQRHVFEAQRPAIAARGLAEAERDLGG
ncbi:MAG: hypothetical protein M3188_07305, partial [Actinomycetota bacterium]|nr:hypothetical protein [Actinomycetota bacterium]